MKKSFDERHADNISRLKLVLIVVCLLAIPISFWANHRDVGSVNSRVTKIESPCLRYGARSKQCREAFEQAVLTITHAQACAILRKAGLKIVDCRGARLKQEVRRGEQRDASAEKRGDAPQTPSTAHQPPRPPHGGHTGHHVTPQNGGIKPPSGPQSPITGALQPPSAPVLQPSPGNSSQTPAAENSNGVTACVESAVSACVKAEAELPLHP